MKNILVTLVALAAIQVDSVQSREFHVSDEEKNTVVFYSEAPIEDFEGATGEIDGYVVWSDSTSVPPQDAEFYLEVNLGALDTGIGLRNRHMRENYLETDQYPYATFTGTLTDVQPISDSSLEITCSGTFDLHGVKRNRSISVRATSTTNGYRVFGEFFVKLEDHSIEIPKLMFLKINQNIRLSIDFHLKDLQR